MSKCYNCGMKFTLKPEDIKCDSCGKIVNFVCHNCKEWFSIYDEENEIKLKECGVCGFFICPNCNVCGINCQKEQWHKKIKNILLNEKLNIDKKIILICDYIEEIKISKKQRVCYRKVPISYARNRIKSCIVRMKGFRIKDEEDMRVFSQRVEKVLDKKIGEILTVNNSREKGSYGQEFRDVFNFCLCTGKLEKIKIKKLIDGEEVEFEAYKRVEKGSCPYLDVKDLIVKICPNKECKIKTYPLSQEECCDPRCNYKTGKNKGKPRKLKLKISTKDICQLNKGDFKKEEDGKSKHY